MNITLTNEHGEELGVVYFNKNVHVYNSYAVPKSNIAGWVKQIKLFGEQHGYAYSRSEQSWANEWKAHNLLFRLGIETHRTKDVDLDEGETWLRKLCYFLLSILCLK